MSAWLETALYALLLVMSVALLVATYRLLRGPTIADRIMALDMIAIILVASLALSAIAFGTTILLDISIVIALISFVGTVAFALFIQRRADR